MEWTCKPGAEFEIKGLPGTWKVGGSYQRGPEDTTEVIYNGYYHYLYLPENLALRLVDAEGFISVNGLKIKPVIPEPEYVLGQAYVDSAGEVFLRGSRQDMDSWHGDEYEDGWVDSCGDFYPDNERGNRVAFPVELLERNK